jgi:hypothetical protein
MVGPTFLERVVAEGVLVDGAPRPYELTVVGAAWAAGVFTTHGEAASHYVEVKASSNTLAVGWTSDIVRHTANTLTVADDWSGMLRGGESVVIRPHKTLAGLFGAGNEAGLGAGEATTADVVSVLTEGAPASFASYYFRTGSTLGGDGWRSSANPFVDQATRPVRMGQGLMIRRRQAEPIDLVLHGFVKLGTLRRTVPSGFSLLDPLAPITDQRASRPLAGVAFTLGGTASSSIMPSGLGMAVTSGTPQTADLVSLAGSLAGFYMAAPSGLSSGGWRLTSNPFEDQQDTLIPAASAVLIQNRNAPRKWARPQPFVVTTP